MSKEHTFYDYIESDESRRNLIKDWLDGEANSVRAQLNYRIELLSASLPGGMEDSVWKPPFVKPLSGGQWKKQKNFIEIRAKHKKNQYRLIGEKIGRDIFLVSWGFHDGKGWHIDVTPTTAQERVQKMVDNPSKYRMEHEH